MPTISDSAAVLQRLDYSETSQVIVFFTREHGKVRAIAKGVKRSTKTRFAVGIDLLDMGRLVISSRHERGSSLATVVEWKQMMSLSGLRERLSRLYAAQYAAEITSRLTEDWDAHADLFDALIATLSGISASDDVLPQVVAYQLGLLRAVGSLALVDRCVMCGRRDDLTHFSAIEGGTVCRHCESAQVEKREVSQATLRALRGDVKVTSHAGVFSLLNYHIAHLMGRGPLLASKLVSPAQQRIVE